MRYYIADCHFFHQNLLTQMDHRPFASVEEMNEAMLERWNKKVRWNDDVIILGDLSLGGPEETNELVRQLNGHLYLIQGNHDRFGKSKGYETTRFGWIRPYTELNDNKRKIVLCHYPILCYDGQYRRDADGVPKAWMLYGHVHDTQDQRNIEQFQEITRATIRTDRDGRPFHVPCQMINCFTMYSDYTPLTLEEWIACDEARMRARRESAQAAADADQPDA